MVNSTGIGAIAGIALVLVIAFVFALFPAESDDTIILVNKNGNDPVNSCAPGNGLILAQNLTDLCDVVIINPATNQLIQYNGSFWVNVDSAFITTNATCTNLGTGTIICASDEDNILGFKSLVAGNGIQITNSSTEITITNTINSLDDLDDVVLVSLDTNQILEYNGTDWVNQGFINFTNAGDNTLYNGHLINVYRDNPAETLDSDFFLELDSDNNSFIWIFTKNGTTWFPTDVLRIGSNTYLFPNNDGTLLTSNNVLEGTGIDVTPSGDTITISNTLPENTQCNNSTGGFGICINDVITLRNLVAGSSISLSSNATHITITNTAPDNTVCANVGTGTVIYKDGECNFKTLVGSPDISVTNTTNTVVIDYNGTAVTSVSGTSPIVSSGGTTPAISCPTCTVDSETWIIVANITATNAQTSITSGTITAYKYLQVQVHTVTQTSTSVWGLQFNGDTATSYDCRASSNGGADALNSNVATATTGETVASGSTSFYTSFINNFSAQKKLITFQITEAVAEDSPPDRREGSCQWSNTSAQITSVQWTRQSGTGTLTTSTNMVVLGHN